MSLESLLINCTLAQWDAWACKGVCANSYGFVTCYPSWLILGGIVFVMILMGFAFEQGFKEGKKNKI